MRPPSDPHAPPVPATRPLGPALAPARFRSGGPGGPGEPNHQPFPAPGVLLDDETLVERSQAGDQEAYGELVRRLERPLFNVALRILRDREEARDATQTAFVKAWMHLDRFERHHRFFSWIYRILLNEALNRVRRRRHEELDPETPDAAATAADGMDRERLRARVTQAVLALKPDQRDVVLLRHWLDMSYEEIGERLGIPAKTVKSRLFSARRTLEDTLKGTDPS